MHPHTTIRCLAGAPRMVRCLSGLLVVLMSGALASTPLAARAPAQSPEVFSHHSAAAYPDSLTASSATESPKASRGESFDSLGLDPIGHLRTALDDMQSSHFQLWTGTWPSAIDWTAAVTNTHLSSAVASLSRAASAVASPVEAQRLEFAAASENELDRYFAQSAAYYFGEDDFAIRNEAYDDMSWVVLGWLEAINAIRAHPWISFSGDDEAVQASELWHATQFVPAFAHRARIFYDLTTKGWDTKLCGGGMVWNPALEPYKNAITNELFISASASMYLYFPGDNISAPFFSFGEDNGNHDSAKPHDPRHRQAAVKAYAWLKNSNMTNQQGLFVDGFHITGWSRHGSIGTGKCDDRNEMVYTYNQGVVLSGLRSLWEATDDTRYLDDGHQLIQNVINATGWSLRESVAADNTDWAGLGRAGVLEDYCDSRGNCGQDPQTFKGIFFHHFKHFCQNLPRKPASPGFTYAADVELLSSHAYRCRKYLPWVEHNALAALASRDSHGRFGMWWGAHNRSDYESALAPALPTGAIDYRNNDSLRSTVRDEQNSPSSHLSLNVQRAQESLSRIALSSPSCIDECQDVNDRGRGRTVETQGGGVAVLNALVDIRRIWS